MPSPVPRPTSLVVKKGSNIRGRTSGAMPVPVSVTARQTKLPGLAEGDRLARGSSMVTASVVIVRVPPSGIASRPLTLRLSRTCSIMPRSA